VPILSDLQTRHRDQAVTTISRTPAAGQ
jgi:hypothetical protein